MEGVYKSNIFKGLSSNEIDIIIDSKYRVRKYNVGSTIALQGDEYNSFLIIDYGVVRCEMTNFAGDSVIIEELQAPLSIAPAILFASKNTLPVTVIAITETQIFSINKYDFTHLLQQDERVLLNFMRSMSDRSKFLANRVRMLRFGTIKNKLAEYLIEQSRIENSLVFDIPNTQQNLADMFGVTRPALSRALGQMTKTGVISSNKNHFVINDRNSLINFAKNI